uniref:McrB family protein n=1 Tax=Flavobacterium sp. TaxID=239 RepID=UPI00404B63C5
MNLLDISNIGKELKDFFSQNKNWREITFNNEDKEKIKTLSNVDKVESHSIKFQSENNIVFVPSQYILFAIKVKPFAVELKKFTDVFEKIKNLNDKNVVGEFIINGNDLTNSSDLSAEDLELFRKMFSSNQSLNFGAKSIINGSTNGYRLRSTSDFFGSVILKIINVPDASSAKLGSLIYNLTENPEVYNYLEVRFSQAESINESKKSILKETEQKIYYGAPGTGKSYKAEQTLNEVDSFFYERITFHPEFDNASFIGSYRPKSNNGLITYEFVPQSFTNIYIKAWNDLENQYFLAIEEINRGNCAEIFGDIFQLLDRNSNYSVSPSDEMKNHITEKLGAEHEGIKKGLKLPPNLTLYATMNTSDQSLFPMDSAFKRRWDWEYIPIYYDEFYDLEGNKPNESFNYVIKDNDGVTLFRWIDFIREVNKIIKKNQNLGMDKCIGNYFIKSKNEEISLKEFINKAIFYLWNDVFKDEEPSESIFEQGKYYEDFFPIETNGKSEVIKIAKALKIISE